MPARTTTAAPLALTADVPRARDGGQAAERTARLRAMVDDCFDLVGRVVRNLGVPTADVDDVVQRVFASAATRLADITRGSERAFLVQAAVRWAANARRVLARRRETGADELPDVVDPAPSPEDLTEQRRAAAILDRLLAAMDLDLRAVFVLDEIEEMSRAEIAHALGIPEGTVASRLRRAREDFQARLAQWKRGASPRAGGVR
jgi:RNA polymerase sigma-70 factor (ECF subfamily)